MLGMRCGLAVVGLGLIMGAAGSAEAGSIVDYKAQGNQVVSSPYSLGGLTATTGGGEQIAIQQDVFFGGLGVVGGLTFDNSGFIFEFIDGSESVLFSFEGGPATEVSFDWGFWLFTTDTSRIFSLEGFGAGGGSLGTVTFNITENQDVSALFGNVPLSAFKITGNSEKAGLVVGVVRFTVSAVPEPESIVTALMGLALVGGLAYRSGRGWRRRA